MGVQVPGRGTELVGGGRSIGLGSAWLARVWSGNLNRILDRIDSGLSRGSIQLTLPDGTTRLLGGHAPGFKATVHLRSYRALLRLATSGSVGWYQAWAAGEWDSPDPVPLFALFMDNAVALGKAGRARGPWRYAARALHWLRRNTRAGSRRNISAHYDLGNDFYAPWLGETMAYSSARFASDIDGIEAAQRAKMAMIADRLRLDEGERVLEIGCGWGTLATTLAERCAARVDAISLSDEQLAYARARWNPSQGAVDFRKQDYRDVTRIYDAIASVEMVEAVGQRYWPDFFDCIARCLRPGGRAAIQFISIRDELFESYARSADFIQTYIFPGGMLVRESEFERLAQERGLTWQDRVGFGLDYARTLRLWRERFERAVEGRLLPAGFDRPFVNLWRFYLMYCEGGFRGGGIDVAQVTLVRRG
ncbi:MAG TPA: cyclopropane-fatty-acyl-phospholipid synthase family protein [Novosphingobium sp.]|nr:cyclopropane-fatty-acyl-phospholipid synthase family protein [Novosphingobium sp.]